MCIHTQKILLNVSLFKNNIEVQDIEIEAGDTDIWLVLQLTC